ncbi:hypothetical protein ACFL2D_03250, partial [Patescibacteria group bacterium]
DNVSPREHKMIREHEIYHLNHPGDPEWKVIINSNLRNDFFNTVRGVARLSLRLPSNTYRLAKERVRKFFTGEQR